MSDPNKPHALYRFRDAAGDLLYVGITHDPGQRWSAHRHDKPWWHEVATIELETHPDRRSVEAAERAAIQSEHPRHNVVHNRGRTSSRTRWVVTPSLGRLVTFTTLRGGYTRTEPLWLHYELEGDPISDDYDPRDRPAVSLFRKWVGRRSSRHIHPGSSWAPIDLGPLLDGSPSRGEVSISWHVQGPSTAEFALDYGIGSFLDHYSQPRDAVTGAYVELSELPVVDKHWRPGRADKGGFIPAATGWKPRPFQSSVDLDYLCDLAETRRPS